MEKLNSFLAKHGTKLILVLLLLTWFKSCSIDSELTIVKKEIRKEKLKIDSLPTAIDLKIEGLNVEKRMIQATDRRLLDVKRQSEIEAEIKTLKESK
jgi:hypothetical protein